MEVSGHLLIPDYAAFVRTQRHAIRALRATLTDHPYLFGSLAAQAGTLPEGVVRLPGGGCGYPGTPPLAAQHSHCRARRAARFQVF